MREINWQFYIKGKTNQKNFTLQNRVGQTNPYFQIIKKFDPPFYRIAIHPEKVITIEEFYLDIPYEFSDEKVLLNGFQTWSTSRMVSINEKEKTTHKLMNWLQGGYGDYRLTSYDYLHSWNYTYIKGNKKAIVLGSLNEDECFHIFEYHPLNKCIRVKLDIKKLMIEDVFQAFNLYIKKEQSRHVLKDYFNILGQKYKNLLNNHRYYGWTSWYNHYTDISEPIILKNLKHYKEKNLSIDFFQIDDGYQTAIGDWLSVNEDFPNGMAFIANKIHKSGYEAGLWVSPFICEKKSKIYRNHSDWLIKDEKGQPVKIGFNPAWSGFYYGLDFRHPQVKAYLRQVFNVIVNHWGYKLLKLDFLFALSFIQSKEKTRGQIFREAMVFLSEISGDAKIIGCGVPLASCYGVFEFCRVSCDIGLKWEDKFLKFLRFKERVSTANAIETTKARREMNHKVFINDPDVFILRENNQNMSKNQRETLYYINLIFGGLLFTSDNISTYDKEKMELLKFGISVKDYEVTNIIEEEYLTVELSSKDDAYLFIMNLTNKRILLKDVESFNKKYIIKEEKLEPYESIKLRSIERI